MPNGVPAVLFILSLLLLLLLALSRPQKCALSMACAQCAAGAGRAVIFRRCRAGRHRCWRAADQGAAMIHAGSPGQAAHS